MTIDDSGASVLPPRSSRARHLFNPGPAKGVEFVGRGREVTTILQGFEHGTSAEIVSTARHGATSLLYEIQRRVLKAGGCAVYLSIDHDLAASDDSLAFWRRVAAADSGVETIRAALDVFARSRREHPDRDALTRAVRAQNTRLTLLLDDFDRLERRVRLVQDNLLETLRGLGQEGRVVTVHASRIPWPGLVRAIGDTTYGSPFFGALRPVVLGPWASSDWLEWKRRTADDLGEPAWGFIERASGRLPLLARALRESVAQQEGLRDAPQTLVRAGIAALLQLQSLHNPWDFRWTPGQRWALISAHLGLSFDVMALPLEPLTGAEQGPAPRDLAGFMRARLNSEELRRMFDEVEPGMAADLPGPPVSDATLFHAAAGLLQRRGLEAELLGELRRSRPRRETERDRTIGARVQPYVAANASSAEELHLLEQSGLLAMSPSGEPHLPPLLRTWVADRLRSARKSREAMRETLWGWRLEARTPAQLDEIFDAAQRAPEREAILAEALP